MAMEFTKGQKVHVVSNDARVSSFEATIVSMGKKYITVADNSSVSRRYKFDRDTLMCVEWSIFRLYANKEDYLQELAMREMKIYIKENIDVLPYAELKNVYEIISNIKAETK